MISCGLLLMAAAWQSNRLKATRRRGMPEAYAGYTASTPAGINFVIAGLGGFRGIVSEILWFRAERLQEENRFLELVQLADWLTMLDPHATEAWAYNAWNLAYNISVMMVRHEDRLRWVRNGITLLRDEGLRFNPKEARLYRELAWIYMNKVGGNLDEACATYQKAFAESMRPALKRDCSVDLSDSSRERLKGMKLSADRMREIEQKFGPVNWSLPESLSLYWSLEGLRYADSTERLLCRRIAYQSLIILIFNPDMTPGRESVDPTALIPATATFIEETVREYPTKTLSQVFLRFLAKATAFSRARGNEELAQACYTRFAALFPLGAKVPPMDRVIRDATAF